MNRLEACQMLIDADDRLKLSAEGLSAALDGWELRPLIRQNQVVGILMISNDEVHVAAVKQARGNCFSRKMIKENLSPILERFGRVTTKVMCDNSRGIDFVQRIGFRESSRVGEMINFELSSIAYA